MEEAAPTEAASGKRNVIYEGTLLAARAELAASCIYAKRYERSWATCQPAQGAYSLCFSAGIAGASTAIMPLIRHVEHASCIKWAGSQMVCSLKLLCMHCLPEEAYGVLCVDVVRAIGVIAADENILGQPTTSELRAVQLDLLQRSIRVPLLSCNRTCKVQAGILGLCFIVSSTFFNSGSARATAYGLRLQQ